jgi:hypothetical protein
LVKKKIIMQREGSTLFKLWIWDASSQVKLILSRMRLYGTNLVQIKWMLNYLKLVCGSIYLNNHNRGSHECVFLITFLIKLFFILFFIRGNFIFWKTYFVGSDERVKLWLSQTLTRGARPDSNSRPAVQILSLLPSRYVPWGLSY